MNENAVPAAANAACPRCGAAFRCGVGDKVCACGAVALDDALRAELQLRWQGCLCVSCLTALTEKTRAGLLTGGAEAEQRGGSRT